MVTARMIADPSCSEGTELQDIGVDVHRLARSRFCQLASVHFLKFMQ